MTTYYDAFDQALPQFERLDPQVDTRVKPSATATAEYTPPLCGIKIPAMHWTDLASRLCLEQHVADLRSKKFPGVDKMIRTEVGSATISYLTHPVHIAYQLVHQGDVCLQEVTKPGNEIASRVRTAYFLGRPSNEDSPGDSTNIFAVMECKKFEGLSRDQFNQGAITTRSAYGEVGRTSLFGQQSDTEAFLKQATIYACEYGTPFVALCDYNTLILLVMNQVEKRSGGRVSTVILPHTGWPC